MNRVMLVLSLVVFGGCCDTECEATENVGGVYRLETDTGRSHDIGSCVAVKFADPRMHFVTIKHATRGVMIVRVGSRMHPAEYVQEWTSDLEPIVLIRTIEPVTGPPLYYVPATSVATEGGTVWMIGYAGGRYRAIRSRITSRQAKFKYYLTHPRVISGMSGGAMIDSDGRLLGIISSTDDEHDRGLAVDMLAASDNLRGFRPVQWNCRNGFCYPQARPQPQPQQGGYIRYESIRPRLFNYPRVDRYEQHVIPPATDSGTIEAAVAAWFAEHGTELHGRDGTDGQDSPQYTVEAIADYLAHNHADQLRGPAGPPGGSGGYDDRGILTRIDTIENQKQRVVVVDGGKIIDDESYARGEPIVLDMRRIIKSGK